MPRNRHKAARDCYEASTSWCSISTLFSEGVHYTRGWIAPLSALNSSGSAARCQATSDHILHAGRPSGEVRAPQTCRRGGIRYWPRPIR
jgi:hypothetical protein